MAETFVRRTTAPSSTNKYYIKTTKGGYNRCIQIQSDGSVLPNCVGYARRGVDSVKNKTYITVIYLEATLKAGGVIQ